MRPTFHAVLALALLFGCMQSAAHADAFTYQGRLTKAGEAVANDVDMRFRLFDDAGGDNQIGAEVEVLNLATESGLFTVDLDFGAGLFGPTTLWLEIDVRDAGDTVYTTLSPRQPLFATPAG